MKRVWAGYVLPEVDRTWLWVYYSKFPYTPYSIYLRETIIVVVFLGLTSQASFFGSQNLCPGGCPKGLVERRTEDPLVIAAASGWIRLSSCVWSTFQHHDSEGL